ncbi:MAG: hydantoinase B/oxoprolinase family protein [Myxococcales bacterium]|nr:hydantoinase B/oxoprolinase family protein [Myxococcales bacterium]
MRAKVQRRDEHGAGGRSVDVEVRWSIAVDRGGTFTDVIATNDAGLRVVSKLLTTSALYPDATLEAIRRILDVAPGTPLPVERLREVRVGTTVATNALLERRGARTALVTTHGFGDALLIGDQTRSDLFGLAHAPRRPLYSEVVAVGERIGPDGEVVTPLDVEGLAAGLRAARARGTTALAIAFLHATVNSAHERLAGEIALREGYGDVALSHRTVAVDRFLPRASTTVADAVLTPPLGAYLSGLSAALPGVPLLVMQSSGGLAEAGQIRGKDAVLSGPAGGVVALGSVATRFELPQLIGFDMGGTSTDVCAYAGGLERAASGVVDGVQLHVPMLAVHTIAAGGGSVLGFDGERLVVGPTSAGARPGPACYGLGGPATVTDANLVLGLLDPQVFPAVFGPAGDTPLSVDAARAALAAIHETLPTVVRDSFGADPLRSLARAFVTVAVETMARGVARVTIERGLDARDFALCAFGGAAGQVACRVADVLGIRTVVVPRDAGVMSASGIATAPRRRVFERAVGRPLEGAASFVAETLDLLRGQQSLEGDAHERVSVRLTARDSAFSLELSAPEVTAAPGEAHWDADLDRRFRDAYHRRYGVSPRGGLWLESVLLTVGDDAAPPGPLDYSPAPAIAVTGPAPTILTFRTHTVAVEPGWSWSQSSAGDVVLTRASAVSTRAQGAFGSARDPVGLAVMGHRFMGIAEAMGLALEQTAVSVNIKERRDYSCALFDADGRLVANAPHIPVHLGSMSDAVAAVIARHEALDDGDAFLVNDPYAGGTHLPDLTLISPVSVGPWRFFVASRGHHADVGGITPGSMPSHSRTIAEEGIVFSGLRVGRDWALDEALLRDALSVGPHPARQPDQNLADLAAQLAANQRGAARLRALADELGDDVVVAYTGHVRDHARQAVARLAGRLPAGAATLPLDDGGEIRVRLTPRPGEPLLIDFTGSSAQLDTNANAPRAVVKAAVLYSLRLLTGEDIPMNDGCLEAVELVIPEGSLLAPRSPAAVVAGNVETSQIICDALLLAAGAMAASQGTMNNVAFGDERVQYYETLAGGAGAGPGFAGASAIQCHMTNSRLTDPEVLERRLPVRVECFEVRRGSGGAGTCDGGDGVRRRLRFLGPLRLSVLSNRRRFGSPGLAGGGDGAPGHQHLERGGAVEPLGHRADVFVHAGDVLHIETPGGGGYGLSPRSRGHDESEPS